MNTFTKKTISFLLIIIAKWICRLGQFYKATDPGVLVIFLGTGLFFTLLSDFNLFNLGFFVLSFLRYGITGGLAFYAVWEFIQGAKWIYRWSERYLYDNC